MGDQVEMAEENFTRKSFINMNSLDSAESPSKNMIIHASLSCGFSDDLVAASPATIVAVHLLKLSEENETLQKTLINHILNADFALCDDLKKQLDLSPFEVLLCGSTAELGYYSFACGDTDIMVSHRNQVALDVKFSESDSVATAKKAERMGKNNMDILNMESDTRYPGYVLLRWGSCNTLYSHKDCKIGFGDLAKYAEHGPALRAKISSYSAKVLEPIDYVLCIKCVQWPHQASNFLTRERKSGWPVNSIIMKIAEQGCHLVPVVHPSHRMKPDDGIARSLFRISFSHAEVILVRSWNVCQKIVYQILRFICDAVDNKSFTRYHMKVAMLWACEEYMSSWWDKETLLMCCCKILQDIIEKIKKSAFKSFFISDYDMLAHMSVMEKENLANDLYYWASSEDELFALVARSAKASSIGSESEKSVVLLRASGPLITSQEIHDYQRFRHKQHVSMKAAALINMLGSVVFTLDQENWSVERLQRLLEKTCAASGKINSQQWCLVDYKSRIIKLTLNVSKAIRMGYTASHIARNDITMADCSAAGLCKNCKKLSEDITGLIEDAVGPELVAGVAKDVISDTITMWYSHTLYILSVKLNLSMLGNARKLADTVIHDPAPAIPYEELWPMSVKLAFTINLVKVNMLDSILEEFLKTPDKEVESDAAKEDTGVQPNQTFQFISEQSPTIFARYIRTMCMISEFKRSTRKTSGLLAKICESRDNYIDYFEDFKGMDTSLATHRRLSSLVNLCIDNLSVENQDMLWLKYKIYSRF